MLSILKLPPPAPFIPPNRYRMEFGEDEAIILVAALRLQVNKSEHEGTIPQTSKPMYDAMYKVVYGG